jgi:HEXXH motif-containing protein
MTGTGHGTTGGGMAGTSRQAPRQWRLTEQDFAGLARGDNDPGTARRLVAARRSRTLLLLKYISDTAPVARPAFELLVELAATAPEAARPVLDHPPVGAWATRTARGLLTDTDARPAELAFLAAAAAVRAGCAAVVRVPPVDRMPLPTLGIVPGRTEGDVTVTDLVWSPTPALRMADGTSFLFGGWPEHTAPTTLPGGEEDVAEWQHGIAAAWELLTRRHPAVASELAIMITQLTPLREVEGRINSATLPAAVGCVFMSLSDDSEQVAVTLTHELQHTKLAALTDLFTFVRPGDDEWHYAPWRPDPRPVAGQLHGVFAYLGVTGFWRTQAVRTGTTRSYQEFARWRSVTLTAAHDLLTSERLTDLGRLFVDGIAGRLSEWCAEPVPAPAVRVARRLADDHRDRWLAAHAAGPPLRP